MPQIINFLDLTLIWILLFSIPLLWFKGYKQVAIRTFLSGFLAWVVAHVIKIYYFVPRPYIANEIEAVINNPPTDGAFPSGHTSTAMAIAMSIFMFNKKAGVISLVIVILVGMIRVLGKVHYPIDILGGIILGGVVALGIKIIYKKLGLEH